MPKLADKTKPTPSRRHRCKRGCKITVRIRSGSCSSWRAPNIQRSRHRFSFFPSAGRGRTTKRPRSTGSSTSLRNFSTRHYNRPVQNSFNRHMPLSSKRSKLFFDILGWRDERIIDTSPLFSSIPKIRLLSARCSRPRKMRAAVPFSTTANGVFHGGFASSLQANFLASVPHDGVSTGLLIFDTIHRCLGASSFFRVMEAATFSHTQR